MYSATTRHALLAACVALPLINVAHIMNTKANSIVREIFMWSRTASCVLLGKLVCSHLCTIWKLSRTSIAIEPFHHLWHRSKH